MLGDFSYLASVKRFRINALVNYKVSTNNTSFSCIVNHLMDFLVSFELFIFFSRVCSFFSELVHSIRSEILNYRMILRYVSIVFALLPAFVTYLASICLQSYLLSYNVYLLQCPITVSPSLNRAFCASRLTSFPV